MDQATEYQFGVRWALNGLSSGVEVHDILLSFSGSPRHVDSMLPLSHYIRTGRNSVQLSAWPVPFEENHELLLSLMYWEPGDNPNTEANTAFEVVMRPGLDNPAPELTFVDENAPLRALANEIRWLDHESYFTLDVPFINRQSMPSWCWEQGDVLQDNAATRNSLTHEYRRLYELFEARDNDALMDASSTMIQELAQASGEPEAYVRHRASFNMFFNSPEVFQLNDFPEDPMTLNLGAHNRVAWLTTQGVNVPIRFNHVKDEGVSSKVRLYFIHRNGQWEICR